MSLLCHMVLLQQQEPLVPAHDTETIWRASKEQNSGISCYKLQMFYKSVNYCENLSYSDTNVSVFISLGHHNATTITCIK